MLGFSFSPCALIFYFWMLRVSASRNINNVLIPKEFKDNYKKI
jgi:hypothetical protein